MSYRQPKFTIQQEFDAIPSAIVEPLQTCIVGPSKRVFDYSDASDRLIISYGAYDPDNSADHSYNGLPAGAVVEQDSISLTIEGLWARYAEAVAGTTRGTAPNIVH